mmetsp:Transcript_33200/g.109755  ORF Transcript_33200/g.109755 Transcript_33200/m.109755 type:complete len:223 (+) Transcript_33200:1419-2087(+)
MRRRSYIACFHELSARASCRRIPNAIESLPRMIRAFSARASAEPSHRLKQRRKLWCRSPEAARRISCRCAWKARHDLKPRRSAALSMHSSAASLRANSTSKAHHEHHAWDVRRLERCASARRPGRRAARCSFHRPSAARIPSRTLRRKEATLSSRSSRSSTVAAQQLRARLRPTARIGAAARCISSRSLTKSIHAAQASSSLEEKRTAATRSSSRLAASSST